MVRFRVTLGVLVVAAIALLGGQAQADSSVKTVHGHVDDQVVTNGSCMAPSLLCTAGHLTGGLNGELTFTITSLIPAEPAGTFFFNARSTIRTNDGDLYCTDSGSFNTAAGSDGEGVHLCIITGGSGMYAGATGYLQEHFFFQGTTGTGQFDGKIVTAS